MGRKSKKRDICIHIANLLCCTVETNNIVKQLYVIKIFLKRKGIFRKKDLD